MARNQTLHTLLVSMFNGATTVENSLVFLKKLNVVQFPYKPAISPLEKCLKELKAEIQTDTVYQCLQHHYSQESQNGNYPVIYCLINGEKRSYSHTMEYYSAIKRIKYLLQHEPKNIMLSERSLTQRAIYCMIPFFRNIPNRDVYRDRKQVSSCQGYPPSPLTQGRYRERLLTGIGFLYGVMGMFWNQ